MIFLDKHTKKKKILEETRSDLIPKLNSGLSFYYCLSAIEKCLDKSLICKLETIKTLLPILLFC